MSDLKVSFNASFNHYDSIKIDVHNNSAKLVLQVPGTEIAQVAKLLLLCREKSFKVTIKQRAADGKEAKNNKKKGKKARYKG